MKSVVKGDNETKGKQKDKENWLCVFALTRVNSFGTKVVCFNKEHSDERAVSPAVTQPFEIRAGSIMILISYIRCHSAALRVAPFHP